MSADQLTHRNVMAHLRQAILSGQLTAGQRITQEQIGDQLGISRTPVREALIQLANEGFVTLVKGKGALVREVSVEDMRDVYDIRIELEGFAARLAAGLTTAEQLAKLSDLLAKMSEAAQEEDVYLLLSLNGEFHRTCYTNVRNRRLLRMIDELRTYSERYRIFHAHIRERVLESRDEHAAIFDALRKRDPKAAEDGLRRNMIGTRDALAQYFALHDRGRWRMLG